MFGKTRFASVALALVLSAPAIAADTPGVTPTEIKIGGVFPFSGPASSIGLVGKGVLAYVQLINDRGGINNRKINYIAMDDAYSPPKAVEHIRKLVDSDEVAFIFSQLGTPGNTAAAKYLHSKGVPTIALVSGSSKFTNVQEFPRTTTGLVSYDVEGQNLRQIPVKGGADRKIRDPLPERRSRKRLRQCVPHLHEERFRQAGGDGCLRSHGADGGFAGR